MVTRCFQATGLAGADIMPIRDCRLLFFLDQLVKIWKLRESDDLTFVEPVATQTATHCGG